MAPPAGRLQTPKRRAETRWARLVTNFPAPRASTPDLLADITYLPFACGDTLVLVQQPAGDALFAQPADEPEAARARVLPMAPGLRDFLVCHADLVVRADELPPYCISRIDGPE